MDEAGIAVLEDIVNELLDDTENDELILGFEAFAVIVKTRAGIHAARATDLLKEVIYGGFETEILECRWHETVGDVAYQLDGIVDDLFGVVDALELSGLVEVDQIFIEV